MKKFLVLFGIVFTVGCLSRQSLNLRNLKSQQKFDTLILYTKTDSVKVLSGDWNATFDYYSTKDSLEIDGIGGELFVKTVTLNNEKFGIAIDSSFLKIYKLQKNHYTQISKEKLEGIDWSMNKMDLNFDGFADIVLTETEGAHGNTFTTVLLYDSVKKTLVHDRNFDLPNISVDHSKKLLRSIWYSSACGNSKKTLYKVENGKISLLEGINYFDSECGTIENEKRYIIFKQHLKDNKAVTDSLFVNPDEAWKIFEKSLWNTKDSW